MAFPLQQPQAGQGLSHLPNMFFESWLPDGEVLRRTGNFKYLPLERNRHRFNYILPGPPVPPGPPHRRGVGLGGRDSYGYQSGFA